MPPAKKRTSTRPAQRPARAPGAGWLDRRKPNFFLALNVGYLAVLGVLATLYATGIGNHDFTSDFPDASIAHTLPLGIPVFGALGAITISLYGVFEHNQRWDPRWNAWHVARPLIGAILGTVSFFIYVAAIQSTNTKVNLTPNAKGSIIYYLVAFVVGYREETFRALIKRFVDVILSPPDGNKNTG